MNIAAVLNDVAAINILAENPALDWNCGGDILTHPLTAALELGNVEAVEILLSQPTLNIIGTGLGGNSLGHFAVESASPVKCVELLSKDPRINWNVRNDNGETPIMLAL